MNNKSVRHTILRYPQSALGAVAYLQRPFNDIDVFVEDTTCRNMYIGLLNRILGNQARIRNIIQVGNRDQVINLCRSQRRSTRKRLYLIDGDFDAITGVSSAPNLKNLYQLKVYCSENLLLSEEAVLTVASQCLTNFNLSRVRSSVKYKTFLRKKVSKLRSLFIVYTAAHILDPSIKTTGYHVNQLTIQLGYSRQISEAKVKSQINNIMASLLASHSKQAIQREINFARSKLPRDYNILAKLICGKTYLFPLLYHHLQKHAKLKDTEDQLKVRLSQYCDINIDADLVNAVKQASRT